MYIMGISEKPTGKKISMALVTRYNIIKCIKINAREE
jgi:hypothetical protein